MAVLVEVRAFSGERAPRCYNRCGFETIWYGRADGRFQLDVAAVQVNRSDLTPLAGDLDGDGRDDISWYSPGNGARRSGGAA